MTDQTVHDKLEIKELLYRYARSADTKDWAGLTSVFTEDAFLDYSSVGYPPGTRDEVVAVLSNALAQVPMTQHFISNIQIALDGDRAKVTAMFYNPMLLPGMTEMSYCGGNYYHDVVRTPDGWKSERLVEENLWFVNPPKPKA
ncbi:MAG: nuclear transport factor 2 family protein [Rhodococcus sp. (in: high G+C Gram-positive bacteria)]|uniref:nuclear transport factor 2 family protein n=1 Tax=Rhodococcus sp. TaxID=1831 RepID=UPI003BB1999B